MNINIVLPSYLCQNNFVDEDLITQLNSLYLNQLVQKSSISICNFNYSDLMYQPLFKGESDNLAIDIAHQLNIANKYKNFLLAKPIHLMASNNSLYVDPNGLIQLSDFEIKTIIQEINSYFKDEIKVFEVKDNLLLIALNIESNYIIKNSSPINMLNKHIYSEDIHLLKDSNLLRINNEIQMLLFNSELNKIRLKQKKLPINSLWLYNYQTNNDLDLYQIINNQNYIYNKNYQLNQITHDHTIVIDSNSMKPIEEPNNWIKTITNYDHLLFKDIFNLFNIKKIKLINLFIPKTNKTIKIRINKQFNLLFWQKTNLSSIFKDIINEI